MMQQSGIFIQRLLQLIAKYEAHEELIWDEDLKFAVLCSDAFYWGAEDVEDVTVETLPMLEQAFKDGGIEEGILLYCARQRQMRPQGAMYKYIKKPELFNVFPIREISMMNPREPDSC